MESFSSSSSSSDGEMGLDRAYWVRSLHREGEMGLITSFFLDEILKDPRQGSPLMRF